MPYEWRLSVMQLEYVPLLQIQRELQGLPGNIRRFRQYLRTMIDYDGPILELPPLGIMIPVGGGRVTAVVGALLGLDAEGMAAGPWRGGCPAGSGGRAEAARGWGRRSR